MSISGSQEVKSAILRRDGVTSGSEEQTRLDAQEDREIVGYDIKADPAEDGSVVGACRFHVGTDPRPGPDEANDNRSFFATVKVNVESDETNGIGLSGDLNEAVWFGHGSGIEWNEDATLTAEVNVPSASGSSLSMVLVVWYREL